MTLINIGPRNSSAFALPNFQPIVQGGAMLGQGLGNMLAGFGANRRRDLSQKQYDDALNYLFSGDDKGFFGAVGGVTDPQQLQTLLAARQSRQPLTPKPTDDMREYELAKSQGFQGTFQDWQDRNVTPASTNRKMFKGADGYNYYADTLERVLPDLNVPGTGDERPMEKDANGRLRYVDTKELVFPDVEVTPDESAAGTATERYMSYLLDPNNDSSTATYLAYYNQLAAPQTTLDRNTGQLMTITPDMSAFRAPTFGQAPTGGQPPVGGEGEATTAATPGGQGVDITRVGDGRFNESQMRAVQAAQMVGEGLESLSTAGSDGKPLFTSLLGAVDTLASGIPMAGNYLVSEEYQQGENALRNVVASILRLETGAAATEFEVEDLMARYAPRPGDTQATIRQKWENLIGRWKSAEKLAGPAYDQQFPEGFNVPGADQLFGDASADDARTSLKSVVGDVVDEARDVANDAAAPVVPTDPVDQVMNGLGLGNAQSTATPNPATTATIPPAEPSMVDRVLGAIGLGPAQADDTGDIDYGTADMSIILGMSGDDITALPPEQQEIVRRRLEEYLGLRAPADNDDIMSDASA